MLSFNFYNLLLRDELSTNNELGPSWAVEATGALENKENGRSRISKNSETEKCTILG